MKSKYYIIGVVLVFIHMLPYFILGEEAYITIPDFMDQDVGIIAVLKNSGLLTSLTGTVPNMDGLDRTLFQSFTPFDLKMLCAFILPSYWSIVIYTFLYRVLAFWGMFLLVDSYIMNFQYRWITVWISFIFAVVPFYVLHGLSGMGLPMIIYAFINLYHSKKIWFSYFLLAVYTFNSMLAYGGFFVLAILFVVLCWDYYKQRIIRKHILAGAALMCFVYVITNWGNIYSMFFSQSFVSHRTEWIYSRSFVDEIIFLLKLISFSNNYAGSMLALPILVLFSYILWKYRDLYPQLNKIASLYFLIIVGVVVGLLLKHLQIHLFVEVQLDRFYFFYPAVIILMLASCCMIYLSKKKKNVVIILILLGLFSVECLNGEFWNNVTMRMMGTKPEYYALKQTNKNSIMRGIYERFYMTHPNYRQFFDKKLFSSIHKDLGTKGDYKTKVVSVGLFPCVAEYNGFYTLDSYRVNYPIDYKYKFRKVIAKELEKDGSIRSYFDNWGSRCYILSSELGNHFLFSKNDDNVVKHLDIDTKALKGLGCQYIFSAVEIGNYRDLNLDYINSYTSSDSYYNIRVYKL